MCCHWLRKPKFNDVCVLFKHSNFCSRMLEMHSKRPKFENFFRNLHSQVAHLPQAFSFSIYSKSYQRPCQWEIDHHIVDYLPYRLWTVCGYFNIPKNSFVQGLWNRAYSLSFFSEKKCSCWQMSLQRQHFLLSCFKTLSVGLAGVWTSSILLGRQVLIQWANRAIVISYNWRQN